jgi:hypothetical protein
MSRRCGGWRVVAAVSHRRLPGDIILRRDHFTFYFPLATGLLLSVVLSLLFWFFGRR